MFFSEDDFTVRDQEAVIDTTKEALDKKIDPINNLNSLGFA